MTPLEPPRAVCPTHVEDAVLQQCIAANATQLQCSYCTVESAVPVAASLEIFMTAFVIGVGVFYRPQHFHTEADAPPDAAVSAEDVAREILRIAGVSHPDLIDDVATTLSVTPAWIAREPKYGSRVEQLAYSWETFKHLVKYELRYFFANRSTGSGDVAGMTAEQLLEAVSDVGQNTPTVWPVSCPTPIYRARMARSKDEASEWLHASDLGAPPSAKAAANRMSPAGISIFYGGTDRVTAIAEAGSHTFYRYVVTGEFSPMREIKLVDLTNLPDPPSIFDAANHKNYFGLSFLHRFVHDITLPVELDGREHIDYVPTQVFTEYLRYAFPDDVDGLMFPSTQGPGNNVVIFVGPDECVDKGTETDSTWLSLDTSTVAISRVMTVAR